MPSSNAFLTGVSYAVKEHRVKVLFENSEEKTVKEFLFVPEIRMPLNNAVRAVAREIVSPQTGLVFSESAEKCALRSPSFNLLRKAHALLSLSLKASIPLIEPERQFLLDQGWSYFDCFELEGGVIGKKQQGTALSQLDLPVDITLREALLSRMLALPASQLPEGPHEKGRVLLENAAFKSSQFVYSEQVVPKSNSPGKVLSGFFELDFSRAILQRIADSNIGFNSLNCGCCKPAGVNSENVLPNSMVEVEFFNNGYFFESLLPSFASFFHENNKGKESRRARKQEFALEQFPIGPFYAGQKAVVPLADARKLEGEGSARQTGKVAELWWSCRRKQSFLARKAMELLSIEASARKKALELERSELREKGLNAFNPCFESREKLALEEVISASQELMRALFFALFAKGNGFSHSRVCGALEAFKGEMLEGFNRQLSRMKSEPIYSFSGREFIRTREVFTDLALASRKIGVPLPSLC